MKEEENSLHENDDDDGMPRLMTWLLQRKILFLAQKRIQISSSIIDPYEKIKFMQQ